jgi:hypothetical protein
MDRNYLVTMASGDTWIMRADMANAAAPIRFVDDEGREQSTPYQTADARHNAGNAAALVVAYWISQGGDRDDVRSVKAQ